MADSTAAREAAAIAVTGLGAWVSLHTADPGTTGASEVTGGSPAYGRKQTTWAAGASDGVVNGSQVTIDVPAGTFTHVGIWTAQSGGSFVCGVAIASVTFGGQGQVLITPSRTQT